MESAVVRILAIAVITPLALLVALAINFNGAQSMPLAWLIIPALAVGVFGSEVVVGYWEKK